MSTILTKYSDYTIQSIEWFITKIETEIAYRGIDELSNGKIQLLRITKQHPLAMLMASQLSDVRGEDPLKSGLLPAISVTPADFQEKGFTLGQSYSAELIDAEFIDEVKAYQDKSNKQIQQNALITPTQIESILSEYRRRPAGSMRFQRNEWSKAEEINISIWSESPDFDILLATLMESILAMVQVGIIGDESPIRDMRYSSAKGLTNFNFGKVLFGTEYNLTFLNTFSNYVIYTDDVITGHEFHGTFRTPGET
jgi:hypothetical protein